MEVIDTQSDITISLCMIARNEQETIEALWMMYAIVSPGLTICQKRQVHLP